MAARLSNTQIHLVDLKASNSKKKKKNLKLGLLGKKSY